MDYRYMPFKFSDSALSRICYMPADSEEVKDLERLMELYPQTINEINEYVISECQQQEYEGSPMYDEYPDRLVVSITVDRIVDKIKNKKSQCTMDAADIKEIVYVLLINEMYRRRLIRKNRRKVNIYPSLPR